MTMTRFLIGSLLVLLASVTHAQAIYRCTDDGGSVLISNSRQGKNCKAIAGDAPMNSSVGTPAKARSASSNPTPGDFPRVGENTQKARDGDRRHILEQELGVEQRGLEQAKRELGEQEAAKQPADRLQAQREKIARHERNIQAIQKELGNLR